MPCIGRQTLNHCATREAPITMFLSINYLSYLQSNFFPYIFLAAYCLITSLYDDYVISFSVE